MSAPKFPQVDLALLKELDSRFPERSPEPGETIKFLRHRGGERAVIRFLAQKYAEQNEVAPSTESA